MTASLPRAFVAALAIAALTCLVLAGKSHAAADAGSFRFQEAIVLPMDLTDTCLGPGATGTLIGTNTNVGRYTQDATSGFHSRGTITTDFRLDLADGRSIVGTLVDHESFNGTPDVNQTDAIQGSATLYDPAGEPLGPLTVHLIMHVTWRDLNGNHQPDPDEFSANVERITLGCP
jgi:hypothetical protein